MSKRGSYKSKLFLVTSSAVVFVTTFVLYTFNTEHVIVVYNPSDWMSLEQYNYVLSTKCAIRNCKLTSDRKNFQNQSAIIYLVTAAPALPATPPVSPSERNPDQAWIFLWLESPVNHVLHGTTYQNEHWRNTVNWTMTYTDNADIPLSYGVTKKRTPPNKNYKDIFKRKAEMVAWVVRKCESPSKREVYVEELRRHGVAVDVYGGCTGEFTDSTELMNNIELNYKFYLSFENSFCKDYITEKFFSYGQLDVVLVARGGGNYSKLLPNNAYINTADFSSVDDLAKYLWKVATDEELYTSYLRNKDQFVFDLEELWERSVCDICEKLNNLDNHRRVYTDLVERIHHGTCHEPNDI